MAGLVLSAAPALALDCTALGGATVAKSVISLPTSGAAVTSAVLTEDPRNGRYCKLLGAIKPVDPAAADILFQLNLPSRWNRKALHMGGVGYDGRLVTGEDGRFADPGKPLALAQGYATFGSDGGHQAASAADAGGFPNNEESLRNFFGDQLKKTHDAALFLMRRYYGRGPRRTYFQGNSGGGRESFVVMQRWPRDYDGVIAIHPAYNFSALQLSGTLLGQALYKPGAWVSPPVADMVAKAVLEACDGLDGLKDGIVGNVKACRGSFDVQRLRCAGKGDPDAVCLSETQIATYKTFDAAMPFRVTLSGLDHFAGWPVLEGADLNGAANSFGTDPVPANPPSLKNSFPYRMGDGLIRNMVVKDPASNSLAFDQTRYAAQLAELSKGLDTNSADLTAFQKRGGKFLLMHGTVDMAIPPGNSVEYYERLKARMGEARVRSFTRFYMAPGFGHTYGAFLVGWDSLGTLDSWVTRGVVPGPQIATDTNPATAGRTRPLCEYPAYPRYNGSGDIHRAESFVCAAP
ncbi:MAG TPA: tannase/feruloyl esterase family alpha/beta hydrolase [Rhizomicrobium sp.]|nr:tannase/feruloyl esterase family alpha/beta hydrolase [Rhizomicrobium sp.]